MGLTQFYCGFPIFTGFLLGFTELNRVLTYNGPVTTTVYRVSFVRWRVEVGHVVDVEKKTQLLLVGSSIATRRKLIGSSMYGRRRSKTNEKRHDSVMEKLGTTQ